MDLNVNDTAMHVNIFNIILRDPFLLDRFVQRTFCSVCYLFILKHCYCTFVWSFVFLISGMNRDSITICVHLFNDLLITFLLWQRQGALAE